MAADLHSSVADNLKKNFNARKKLRGAIEAVAFMNKLHLHPTGGSHQDLTSASRDDLAAVTNDMSLDGTHG